MTREKYQQAINEINASGIFSIAASSETHHLFFVAGLEKIQWLHVSMQNGIKWTDWWGNPISFIEIYERFPDSIQQKLIYHFDLFNL